MTSKIKVDNIANQSDSNIVNKCSTTITVGTGSDTTNVPGAAVVTGNVTGANVIASGNVVKSNAYQASDAGNIISQSGTTITLGASGDTVSLASGASQSGFGRSGSVNWETTPKTSTFTAVSGEGYFINQSSAITANLPAGSAGAIVAFADYARNFATYNLTISPNGSEKIGGIAAAAKLTVNGQAATFIYVDATKGWINVQNAEDTEIGLPPEYVTATGGTITTCGDFKIHTFTGPGTFAVSCAGNACGSNTVDYLVVAGGGGGGGNSVGNSGGGGGGGYRPFVCSSVSAISYPVTVGGGGGVQSQGSTSSVFSNSSTGGGRGGNYNSPNPGGPGGSGGGGAQTGAAGGSGNAGGYSPPEGFNGAASGGVNGGGGGGAGSTGTTGPGGANQAGGAGGNGSSAWPGDSTTRAGGGGGSGHGSGAGGAGGPGGGGKGAAGSVAGSGNTGGGGGGGGEGDGGSGGGSGIVLIKYKFQN
jgi:hypothetical protein